MWVIVLLSLLTVLLAAVFAQTLAARRLLGRRQQHLEAVWLARAGVELAAGRVLEGPADYKGETTEIVPGRSVRIEVRREPGAGDVVLITSAARFTGQDNRPVSHTLERRFRRVVAKDRVRLEPVVAPAAVPATPPAKGPAEGP
jgi:hypothetical protein